MLFSGDWVSLTAVFCVFCSLIALIGWTQLLSLLDHSTQPWRRKEKKENYKMNKQTVLSSFKRLFYLAFLSPIIWAMSKFLVEKCIQGMRVTPRIRFCLQTESFKFWDLDSGLSIPKCNVFPRLRFARCLTDYIMSSSSFRIIFQCLRGQAWTRAQTRGFNKQTDNINLNWETNF